MVTTDDNAAIYNKQVLDRLLNGILIYQAIRNQAGELIDFRYRYANQRAADWLGLSVDELVTQTLNKLYPNDDTLFERYCQVMRTGESRRFAFERQPVGHLPLQWFDAQLEPLDDGIVCSFVDITDYKLTEQDRQAAHDLIEGIFEASPWAIVYLTPVYSSAGDVIDFVFSLANKAAVAVGGRPLGALVGNRMLEMYPATRTVGLFDQYVRVCQTGEPFETDVFYKGEGITDWAHIIAVRQGDGIVLTNSNINARKQAEAEIIKNLTLLQQTEEIASTGSWEYNRTTDHLTWSPGMYRLFDLPPGTPVTADVYTRYATNQTQSVAQRLVDYLIEGHGPFDDVVTIQTDHGEKVLKIKANVIPGSVGEPLRLLGIDKDITTWVKTQAQLEQTALNLQAVLNTSPASIVYLKAIRDQNAVVTDMQVVVANQRFARTSGKTLTDLPGTSIHQLEHVLWGNRTWPELVRVLEMDKVHYEEQPQVKGNKTHWLALSASRQDDGVVVTGLDITELRQIQQQQTELFRQAGQSAHTVNQLTYLQNQLQKRGELLRTSSHDLRGSLSIVQGAAGLLAFAHTDEDRTQMLSMIQRNVQEATRLIGNLLDYARLETGQEQLQIAPFNVGELLTRLSHNVEPVVRNKKLDFRIEGPHSLNLMGDAVQVWRIAQNLVLNALKYTHMGSVTLCWACDSPQEWHFSVIDTGPGIPAELMRRLVHNTTETPLDFDQLAPNDANSPLKPMSDEGIGLQIVQQLIQLMGGRLAVESGLQGSTFRVTLPRYQ